MRKNLYALGCGLIFGFGLVISGMVYPEVIISGLRFGTPAFTPDLLITFASALSVTFLLYSVFLYRGKTLTGAEPKLPVKERIDWPLTAGASLFGIGWGMTGLCPGPNLVGLGLWHYPIYWVPFLGVVSGYFAVKIMRGRARY